MKKLSDITREFHIHRRSVGFSPRTERSIRPMLKLFFEYLRKNFSVETVSDLRPLHLHAYQRHLSIITNKKGLPLKAGSVNNRIAAVRTFTEFLSREGLASPALPGHISFVKTPRLLPTSVLTHSQVRRLIGKIGTSSPEGCRDRTMIELLYSTGVRNAELVSLTLDSVDFDAGTMKVLGKGNKERVVPIGKTALQWLTSYVRGVRPFIRRASDHREIFLNHHGYPLRGETLQQIVRRHALKAVPDMTVTPHTFRRSCATEMIRGNANIYHVKDLLGHENLDTLRHYTKLTILDLKKTHAKCHPREKD